jgi:type I restriction enzyme, S subunit
MTTDQPFPRVTLSEVLELLQSGQRPAGGATAASGEIPSLGGENIDRSGQLILGAVKRVPEPYFRSMRSGHLQAGDVLINKDGAQTGKVAQYRGEYPLAAINEHLFLLRGSSAFLDQEFLLHHLLAPETQAWIRRYITGSAQPGLNRSFVNGVAVALPDLREQRRIAEILNAADSTIRSTERLISKLDQMARGLVHDLLTRGIDAHGAMRDPTLHPDQFIESPLGRIPEAWQCERLGAVCGLQVGFAFSSAWFLTDGGTRLLRGENVGVGTLDWSASRFLDPDRAAGFAEFLLNPGDVVIGMDRTFTKSGFKVSDVTSDDTPCLLVQRVGRFVPRAISTEFLRCVLRSPEFFRQLVAMQKGMDIPHLSKSEILSPLIPFPSMEEQDRIARASGSLEARTSSEAALLAKLRGLKTALVDALVTGRVRMGPDSGGAG